MGVLKFFTSHPIRGLEMKFIAPCRQEARFSLNQNIALQWSCGCFSAQESTPHSSHSRENIRQQSVTFMFLSANLILLFTLGYRSAVMLTSEAGTGMGF